MNLKEAFRYQKYYDSLLSRGEYILKDPDYITETTSVHLGSKVKAEFKDEVEKSSASDEYNSSINGIVLFLEHILSEKEKLSAAITDAKKSISFDLDAAIAVNIKRQGLRDVLAYMASLKPSETYTRNGGSGYTFNAEGNQVKYACDLKKVTSINFDRNMVRGKARLLSELSDQTSSKVDVAMVTTEVDYVSPYDAHDTFDEAFEAFTNR